MKYTVIYTDGERDYTYTCETNSIESALEACYVECVEDNDGYEIIRALADIDGVMTEVYRDWTV